MAENRIKNNNPLSSSANSRANSSAANNLLNSIHRGTSSQGRISSRVSLIGQNSSRFRSISSNTGRVAPRTSQRTESSSGRRFSSRIGGARSFTSHKGNKGGRSLSRDSILMMQVDQNGDRRLDLEEILLYVLDVKSRGQVVPTSLYKLHPQFEDIVETVNLVDSNNDLDIQDSEAVKALVKDRANLINEAGINANAFDFVLNYLNDNIEDLSDALAIVDTNTDSPAEVSDLEVLAALLSSKKGELDINDPYIDTVLRSNSNFTRLVSLVDSMEIDFDGNITDEQTFDILLALRGDDTGEAIIQQALFLSTNENLEEIERSINIIDSVEDGQISNEEFLDLLMRSRADEAFEAEHQIAIDILKAREPYKSIFDIITALDSVEDGQISDNEVIAFTLASLRGDLSLDSDLVETIIHDENRNVTLIRDLIGQVDTEATNPGEISPDEFLTATTEMLTNSAIGPESKELIRKIIAHSPNSIEILAALDFIDTNDSNDISEVEVIKAIKAKYRGETEALNADFFEMVLSHNADKTDLNELIDLLNPAKDGNPSLEDSFNFVINFKNGSLAYDEELIRAVIAEFPEAQTILNTYEIMETGDDGIDLREYTTALMAMNRGDISKPSAEIMAKFSEHIEGADIVNEGITSLDTLVVDGLVSAQEFLDNFNQLFLRADNTVDMDKLSTFMTVSDIIYPDSAALAQFIEDVDTTEETPVNIISKWEVIDAYFNLNNRSITDPGEDIVNVVLSRNPEKDIIAALVPKIDADEDGEVNNIELTKNLLKFRRDEFTEDPGLIQYIFNEKNSQFDSVSGLIDAFDGDRDGIVSDLELFSELFNNREGIYPGFTQEESDAIITELKKTNPNSAAITELVNSLDTDNSGNVDYDELVTKLLAISAGTDANFSNELKQNIPGITDALESEELIDIVDSDIKDGNISDLEIANLLLADKASNILASYNPELVAAIYRSNGNKTRVEEIVNQLDTSNSGTIEREEVIAAVMSQRANPDSFGTDYALVLEILNKHNSESGDIQTIISQIDTDNTGTVSAQEAMNTLVAEALGNRVGADAEIANQIIDDHGSETVAVRAAFDAITALGIDLSSEDLVQDLLVLWIEMQQGTRTIEYFDELVNALGISDFGSLKAQFQEIAGEDLVIQPDEYGQLMVDIITGSKSQAEYGRLIGILNTADPDLAAINTVINAFNKDGDNLLSDQNILEGVIAIRRGGDLSLMSASYIQTLLASNSDSTGIIKLLDLVDPDQTGSLTPAATEQVWLDTVAVKQAERRGAPFNPAYDFNGDGSVSRADKDTAAMLNEYSKNPSRGFAIIH